MKRSIVYNLYEIVFDEIKVLKPRHVLRGSFPTHHIADCELHGLKSSNPSNIYKIFSTFEEQDSEGIHSVGI